MRKSKSNRSGFHGRKANDDGGGARPGADRPKGSLSTPEFQAYVRQFAPEAIDVLARIMRDNRAPARVRMQAACELLSRGHGKPPQATDTPREDLPTGEYETLEEAKEALRKEGIVIDQVLQ